MVIIVQGLAGVYAAKLLLGASGYLAHLMQHTPTPSPLSQPSDETPFTATELRENKSTSTIIANVSSEVLNITKKVLNITNTTSTKDDEEEPSTNYTTVALIVFSASLVGFMGYKYFFPKKKTPPARALAPAPPPGSDPASPTSPASSSPPGSDPASPPALALAPPTSPASSSPPAPPSAPPPAPPILKETLGLALVDKICDHIPGLSIISNIINIVQKIFLKICKPSKLSNYYTHLTNKSWSRCFVSMIPFFGGFISDKYKL